MSLYLGDMPIANDGSHRLTGEIGDMGFAPLGIDETLNLRRYLNGQVISQSLSPSFTTKVKQAIALHSSLGTTESNWQSEKTLSKLGQCGKFVVDDTEGTIRLPAIVNAQGLLQLSAIGTIKDESLPNITGQTRAAINQSGLGWTSNGALYGSRSGQGHVPPSSSDYTFNDTINLDASLSSSTYQTDAPVQQEAVQYPYYIQIATGVEETLPAIREYDINTPYFFGQSQYFEVAPQNASWLVSNGQWNLGSVYPDFWVQLTGVELNASLNVGDTIEISGKTYVKRGLPVVLSSATYTDYDFVVDSGNSQFRLPLLNGEETTPSMLRYIDVPLPTSGQSTQPAPANGYYTILGYAPTGSVPSQTNPMYITLVAGGKNQRAIGTTTNALGVTVAACKDMTCYVEYSNFSITSQSYAYFRFYYNKGNGSLCYYVGDTVQDTSLINAGSVLTALTNKADVDAGNFSTTGKSLLAGIGMPDTANAQFVSNSFATNINFTAPANGWYCCRAISTTTSGNMLLFITAINSSDVAVPPYNGGSFPTISTSTARQVILPVCAGQKIQVQYSNANFSGDAYCGLWFIPAKGEN